MTEETPKKMNAYQRVHAVMCDVSGVEKLGKHAQGWKYQGHADVTRALRDSYCKHGLVRRTTLEHHERDGGTFRAVYIVQFVNIDDPDDFVQCREVAESGSKGDVAPGVAKSYAIKMVEVKLFALTDEATPDTEATDTSQVSAPAPVAKASPVAKAAPLAPAETPASKVAADPEAPVDVKQTELEQRREALATDPPMTEEQQKRSRTLRERLGLNAQSAQKWLKQNFDVDFTALGKPGGRALADRVIAKLQAELEAQNKAAVNP